LNRTEIDLNLRDVIDESHDDPESVRVGERVRRLMRYDLT
jgi:hypothetical protein